VTEEWLDLKEKEKKEEIDFKLDQQSDK